MKGSNSTKAGGPIPLAEFLLPDAVTGRARYLRLADHIIGLVRAGRLRPGDRLPPSRSLAAALGVNRKTVIAAYADVTEQGYLTARRGSGVAVARHLPAETRIGGVPEVGPPEKAGFRFATRSGVPPRAPQGWLRVTEGAPDVRLTSLDYLHTEMRRLSRRGPGRELLGYGSAFGDDLLRKELATYLRTSRGLPIEGESVLITRGSQQGFQLASRLLFHEGGLLAVSELHYPSLAAVAESYGAELLILPLDARGLVVEALRDHPRLADVRAVYVTPHHQYPTTVVLAAERRLLLLQLAADHGFAILEDDYDYDFQYAAAAQLPLAALDRDGSVLYLGSFSKILAPNVRVGYLCGPPDFIRSAAAFRALTDRQGDLLLERALARYLAAGEVDRHLRRVLPVYRRRRDLLASGLGIPPPVGGMAVWTPRPPRLATEELMARARDAHIWLEPALTWLTRSDHLRLGFAALNEAEIGRLLAVLKAAE